MNLGFVNVEAGFARAKNTVNILSKNFIVFAVSSPGLLLLGGIIFGGGNPILGTEHLFRGSVLISFPLNETHSVLGNEEYHLFPYKIRYTNLYYYYSI